LRRKSAFTFFCKDLTENLKQEVVALAGIFVKNITHMQQGRRRYENTQNAVGLFNFCAPRTLFPV